MNPRKRKAPDSLLPTHRPPKHPRRHLRADWCNLFMDACELMRDTAVKGMETLIQLIPGTSPTLVPSPPSDGFLSGSSKQPSETFYPTRPQSPHAEVSSPPQLSSPTESHELPTRNDSSVPSNSTSFISSDTDGAPHSTSTGLTSVKSVPVPTAQNDPLDVGLAHSMHECQINHHVQTTLARLPIKPHIYQRQHETRVRETRKQDRQKMLQELHEIKRQKGFTVEYRIFGIPARI
ncbi:hypothetical protein EV401DRAFT_1444385 [Pisolithus croceorrhizus]|nr:hypothetical protein EV401DRAFT_1444385 [Pisolithus croceorrhizus]